MGMVSSGQSNSQILDSDPDANPTLDRRYDLTKGVSNLPGRPISLVIANTTSSHFTGLRFVQSQFWTMALTHTQDVLLDNIYVNSTSSNSVGLFPFFLTFVG